MARLFGQQAGGNLSRFVMILTGLEVLPNSFTECRDLTKIFMLAWQVFHCEPYPLPSFMSRNVFCSPSTMDLFL